VEWWVASGIGVALFQQELDAFARDIGAGSHKTVILVLDNAGWRVSRKLRPPDGVRLCFPPPYAPKLQPAERPWPLTNKGVAKTGRLIASTSSPTASIDDTPHSPTNQVSFAQTPASTGDRTIPAESVLVVAGKLQPLQLRVWHQHPGEPLE